MIEFVTVMILGSLSSRADEPTPLSKSNYGFQAGKAMAYQIYSLTEKLYKTKMARRRKRV
ncbi:hypothetical protein FPE01S_05_00980 [Flavihumibacter petaseus NBRC 106054]|uniref:Uncharacterized protein n=1 Tax=Flavihumibacter petaseus NBRC 106054 TaxID=1220578 RepID=A0A0E9N6I7_9BACT|nr:hypothetical protein FPE01S_05_00980 [Flavihumibacter petaseus NBRC 106054]